MDFGSPKLRGLRIALNSANKYTVRPPEFQVDHFVIGGGMSRTWLSHSLLRSYHRFLLGVVGLAVARQLVFRHPENATYLVERHNRARGETR